MNKPIALMIIGALLLLGSLAYHFTYETGNKGDLAKAPPHHAAVIAKALPDVISYVPDDTIVFFGGLEPLSIKDALQLTHPEQIKMQNEQWQTLLASEGFKNYPPAARMLAALLVEYSDLLLDRAHFAEKIGIPEKLEGAFYTVGAIPVLRVKLSNAAAFSAFVAEAEKKASVTGEKESFKGADFLTYSFEKMGSPQEHPLKLAVAQYQDYAVLPLETSTESD